MSIVIFMSHGSRLSPGSTSMAGCVKNSEIITVTHIVRETTFKSQEVTPSHPSKPSVCNAVSCSSAAALTPHSSYSKNELHSATALHCQLKMVEKKCVHDTGSELAIVFHC